MTDPMQQHGVLGDDLVAADVEADNWTCPDPTAT